MLGLKIGDKDCGKSVECCIWLTAVDKTFYILLYMADFVTYAELRLSSTDLKYLSFSDSRTALYGLP